MKAGGLGPRSGFGSAFQLTLDSTESSKRPEPTHQGGMWAHVFCFWGNRIIKANELSWYSASA